MRDHQPPHLSRLLSMDSHPSLPRLSVCSGRSLSSAWILPSRGFVYPFSHLSFRWVPLFAGHDRSSFLFFLLSPSLSSILTRGQRDIPSFFCLLTRISLRILYDFPTSSEGKFPHIV